MKKLVHNLVTVGLLGGLAFFVSGCDIPGKYTGGGLMDSAIEEGNKANLGFNMQAIDTDEDGRIDLVKGQLQYHDHGTDDGDYPKGVKFHGDITDGHVEYRPISGLVYGDFEGTYTIPGNKSGGGTFEVQVFDEGEPGPSEDDYVKIKVTSGDYDNYKNRGALNNGNIKFHE